MGTVPRPVWCRSAQSTSCTIDLPWCSNPGPTSGAGGFLDGEQRFGGAHQGPLIDSVLARDWIRDVRPRTRAGMPCPRLPARPSPRTSRAPARPVRLSGTRTRRPSNGRQRIWCPGWSPRPRQRRDVHRTKPWCSARDRSHSQQVIRSIGTPPLGSSIPATLSARSWSASRQAGSRRNDSHRAIFVPRRPGRSSRARQ